jgi:hypothetical protein
VLGLACVLGLAPAFATDDTGNNPKSGKAPAPAATNPLDTALDESGCHGTAINFLDTPSDAAKKAKKDEKLVFILHVSGNFEDPKYT